MINVLFILGLVLFISIMIQYSNLALKGLFFKLTPPKKNLSLNYPDIDILIPCHNEGVVLVDTLSAMVRLNYPGNLYIYALNDNSADNTAEIAATFAKAYKNVFHIDVPPGEPKGKSRVLNYGLSISHSPYFIVYDGDNQPEPNAVKYLIEALLTNENCVGSVGIVRTINADSNLLTRMIAIEFQVFQLILQTGRWASSQVGSLPGTNMLLNREALYALGGYDEYALAEDAELTIRIAAAGYNIAIEPKSITWEQEPETLKALIGQRTRWAQGNIYIMFKFFKTPSWYTKKCFHHLYHYFSVYILFPFVIIISNVVFILGLLGLLHLDLKLPFLFIWFITYFTYTMQLLIAQWYDNTLTPKNLLVSSIMYFTYAQLFVLLLFKGFVGYFKMKKSGQVHWEKTSRVKTKK